MVERRVEHWEHWKALTTVAAWDLTTAAGKAYWLVVQKEPLVAVAKAGRLAD